MKFRLIFYISLILCTNVPVAHSMGKNLWIKFVEEPNLINYKLCEQDLMESRRKYFVEKSISRKSDTNVFKQLIAHPQLYNEFNGLIRNGDEFAIMLAPLIYPFTDAATTEDLCRSMGVIITKSPRAFLYALLINGENDRLFIACALKMYPFEYVDRIKEKILETKRRISSLKSIEDAKIEGLKTECLKILNEKLISLEKRQGGTLGAP